MLSDHTSKVCSKCRESKPKSEFHRDAQTKDGLYRWCNQCQAARKKERYVPRSRPTPLERFLSRIDKDGPVPVHRPELGPCWIWTARKNRQGYGCMNRDGKGVYAHRLSYELANGPFDERLDVLHECDNPACVRPEHLRLGTDQDNQDDMWQKGRRATKLTGAQVSEIRQRYTGAFGQQKALSEEFGVTPSYIHCIVRGKCGKSR